MSELVKVCFTCRKTDCKKFYQVQSGDKDNITYLDKLKTCITTDLIEKENMEMCGMCIKHLRISYSFRITVLMSQELMRNSTTDSEELIKKEDVCEELKDFLDVSDNYDIHPKSESESDIDDFVKSDNYSSDESSDKSVEISKKRRQKRKHKTKFKDDETFTCEYCGSHFGKNWKLQKHLARVHNEVRKHICPYCGKEFKQAYHLKEHVTSHTGEKNYTCPICDKKFQRQSSQRRHIKGHDAPPGHKTKRTPFLCTICGKSFPFSNGVQRHMRIHLGIKNFECKLCNRRFTQSTHLQVHMRTHTGEKPYICDTCGEKFSLKSCMLKHINNRHYKANNLVEDMPIFYFSKEFEQN